MMATWRSSPVSTNSRCATSTSFTSLRNCSSVLAISFVRATSSAASTAKYAFRNATIPRTTGIRASSQNPSRSFCSNVQGIGQRAPLRLLDEQHFLHIVDFLEFYFDDLVGRCLYHSADV